MLTLSRHVPLPTHKEHQPPHVRERRGWTLGTDPHTESQQLQPLLGSADLASRKSVFRGHTKPIMHSWVCLSLLMTSHRPRRCSSTLELCSQSGLTTRKTWSAGWPSLSAWQIQTCVVYRVWYAHTTTCFSPPPFACDPLLPVPLLASPLEKMTVFPSALWKGMGSPWWQERAQP